MTKFKIEDCKRSGSNFEGKEKGKQNLVKINGYWIWWCYKHNQPIAWCEQQHLEEKLSNINAILRGKKWPK